jgi:DNA replication protein DnaC
MLKTPTIEKMMQMKLNGMLKALEEQEGQSGYKEMSFTERLGFLIDNEHLERENKKLASRLKRAKLKQQACIEGIDFSPRRGIDKNAVLTFANCQWVKEHRNIIITGFTGVGKSYMSCALAHQACMRGHTSLYVRAPRLFSELEVAKADGRYDRVLKSYSKADILIIDDWGLTKLTAREERELLEVMEDRYELKSTIIASQVPVKNWHELIPNKTIADAILDRIVHNSYRIEIDGDSMRKKENAKEKTEKAV